MFDRFSDRARKVLSLAAQTAGRLKHGAIGPEHILFGLVAEGTGVAANVMENLDVDLNRVRDALEPLMPSGTANIDGSEVPFTPAGKNSLEHAAEESRSLDHNYVGTEHLLLGLLRGADGIAAKVLLQLGLDLEKTRNEVREFLGMPSEGDPQSNEADFLKFAPSPSEPENPDQQSTEVTEPATSKPKETHPFAKVNAVLGLADNEAVRNGSLLIEPAHLLAGIAVHFSHSAQWGIDFVALLQALDIRLLPQEVSENTSARKYSAHSEEVLRLALKHAVALNSVSAGPEHLIMGILELGRGPAFDALTLQNVTLDSFREKFRPKP